MPFRPAERVHRVARGSKAPRDGTRLLRSTICSVAREVIERLTAEAGGRLVFVPRMSAIGR